MYGEQKQKKEKIAYSLECYMEDVVNNLRMLITEFIKLCNKFHSLKEDISYIRHVISQSLENLNISNIRVIKKILDNIIKACLPKAQQAEFDISQYNQLVANIEKQLLFLEAYTCVKIIRNLISQPLSGGLDTKISNIINSKLEKLEDLLITAQETEPDKLNQILQLFEEILNNLTILKQEQMNTDIIHNLDKQFAALEQEILNLLSIQLEELEQPTQTEGQDN